MLLVAAVSAGCSPTSAEPEPGATGSPSAATSATSHTSETGPAASGSATPARPWSIVALGDSVPAGNACGCTPYPELTGQDLAAPPDRKVTVTNDAVSGYTTTDVLAQLQTDATVSDKVRSADIVEIEIGANDVGYSDSCGDAVSCYAPTVPEVEKNLGTIVSLVRQLTAGRQVLIVLLDYWSVWLGGQYAAAQGDAYVASAAEVTDQVNTVIASTADRTGSAYVDLRAAFKGPDYSYDETHYLAPDGDHPNATGHQQIASATVAVIRSALHLDPTGKS
ncbi:lysophospholipase L1-like esterase [Humibacillus xanthopallidus]|uniref:Lysophospholipase L1-like esterase n=1 Tax=Humibacillus xanthopallidus TaxID=412689 RepID=A0A543PW37_9MICO|nr:lysophospholipase L1-like esterase [Humibacillus xanthopallidus]